MKVGRSAVGREAVGHAARTTLLEGNYRNYPDIEFDVLHTVLFGGTWSTISRALNLSDRESEIVRLLMQDQSERVIGEELRISSHTVHTHLERLYRKLNVTSRCQVVIRVFDAFVSLEDRGTAQNPLDAMSNGLSVEQQVPQDHPLRAIRAMADDVWRDMSHELDEMHTLAKWPAVPPERLLRAQLLQIFYSIRSERLLMEQLSYNLLFRWFVGLNNNDPVWSPMMFAIDRDRLLTEGTARDFLRRAVDGARHLLSDEHFTVDRTLIDWWVSGASDRSSAREAAEAGPGLRH